MALERAVWRGRRVFVTGHTGFKGAWLCLWLQSLGAELTGFALAPPTQPSLFEAARVGEGMRSLTGDVRDLDGLAAALAAARPEVVIHLAAQSLVRRSYEDAVDTYATNIMGTVHLLEAARRSPGARVVINVTSDKCYENQERERGYREDEPMGGFDPYSSSKGCSELVTAAYRRSFFAGTGGAALASARAGNVIGGGDWAADRLVPDFVRAHQAGRPLVVRHPDAVRPWQFVLDPLHGYLMLAEALWRSPAKFAEAWNFGPPAEDERPVRWMVETLAGKWGRGARWESAAGKQPHEARTLRLDCSKARARLGWRPRVTLEEAIGGIVDWFGALAGAGDARGATLGQIAWFERKIAEESA